MLILISKLKFFIKLWIHEVYAYAYRVELPDGNYELLPEPEGELAEGEVNLVEVQQDPNQISEELLTYFASEGKPRSITQFSNLCNFVCLCLCIKSQELNWNSKCMILGSYIQILAW